MTAGLSSRKKIVGTIKSDRIPAEAQNQYRKATLLLDQGKTEDALQGFQQALDIAPNYTEALHETGYCLQNLGRHDEARKYYTQALKEIGDRLCEIGRYEESLGRYWVAISRYEEASKYYQPECMPEPVMNDDYEKIKRKIKKTDIDSE
ncbi:tetratricopeptide repeat protein [Methanoregula sp. PtaB.Bin085]|uniref:tetratricopeptide repeat protein n=1 Tax=Methanoregula sp. PtaB.Bin085 TaxID=1811680 RepID=UPI0009C741E1|nr:tetratricopeptide repeat protein [Methanoregula sp. PtaB.Bin085]OPX62327.1 MAG: Tetratricopeptide repeat protein [Methanoregula sp. PtaB.Bin085]